MTEAPRVILLDHADGPNDELDPTRLRSLVATSVVNGEHSLEVVTTQELRKNERLLCQDGRGYWHEYVVEGIETEHSDAHEVVHTYYCVWSLQHDLGQTFVDNEYGCGIVPGHASVPHPAVDGLTIALSSTDRWNIGTITVTTQAAASFYRRSGWEALQTVVEKWGGELDATIEIQDGVVLRTVNLYAHLGSTDAQRRFDYGGDVAGIRRIVSDDPWTCRIIPLGKGQETEEGGYTRRPTIASVNNGELWLENSFMVPYTRVPDGAGGWEYPVQIVYNDTYEEPADLKAWALDHIGDYTQPKVSYEIDVVQLGRAGISPHGVSLGDNVAVIDHDFGEDGLRLDARVLKIVENLLDESDIELTISTLPTTLADQMNGIERMAADTADQVSSANVWRGSGTYVTDLIKRINAQANATGGYTYITEGDGIRTYDAPVSDPLVGSEASKVVEVKGGTIRIANTKDSGGNWEWKTLIVSGLVAAECVAAMAIAGGGMARVVSDGLEVLDSNGDVVAKFGHTSRVGLREASGDINTVTDSSGFHIYDYLTKMCSFYFEDGSSTSSPIAHIDSEYGIFLNGYPKSYDGNQVGRTRIEMRAMRSNLDGVNAEIDIIANSDDSGHHSGAPRVAALHIRGGTTYSDGTTGIDSNPSITYTDPYDTRGQYLELGRPTFYQFSSGSNVSIAAGIDSGASGTFSSTLPAGKYIIIARFTFNTADSSGSRLIQGTIVVNGVDWAHQRVYNAGNNYSVIQAVDSGSPTVDANGQWTLGWRMSSSIAATTNKSSCIFNVIRLN